MLNEAQKDYYFALTKAWNKGEQWRSNWKLSPVNQFEGKAVQQIVSKTKRTINKWRE